MATCPAYSAAKAAVQARFLLPAWGKLKVRNSRRSDITDVLDKILEKDQFVQANRVRALISKMLNFAIEEEMIEEGFANPAAHLPRRPAETPRDRYLTGDEIRRLWELLPQSPMGAIYRMILLTGQRPGEVKSMKWADIKDDIWTVPAALAKNGRANPVPLSTLARNILESLKPESSEFVFVSPRGGHLRWFSRATRQLNQACGFRFTPHDLRRTCSTNLQKLGIPQIVLQAILNHTDRSVTAIYGRYDFLAEKRTYLEQWAETIDRLLEKDVAP